MSQLEPPTPSSKLDFTISTGANIEDRNSSFSFTEVPLMPLPGACTSSEPVTSTLPKVGTEESESSIESSNVPIGSSSLPSTQCFFSI
eukprot:snap_masked-scaffold_17-processed-gene-3.18-mRNA-1 protein AED:1.00 eAED:1.00 QI:0/-1/0/0/-1/1/1/0/87